jgi:hypothetical protein
MKKSCFGLRCHEFSDVEQQILEKALQYFDYDAVFVVVDERKGRIEVPEHIKVIPLDEKAIANMELFSHPQAGWLCGDYFYYALANAKPDFDFYWLCESDVYLSFDNPGDFFEKYERVEADFLALRFGPRDSKWHWASKVQTISNSAFGCLFPLTRLSRPAIIHLLKERKKLLQSLTNEVEKARRWANDESFVCTTLVRDQFICKNLESYEGKEVFEHFSHDKVISLPAALHDFPRNRVLHPVLDKRRLLEKCKREMRWVLDKEEMRNSIAALIKYADKPLRDEIRVSLLEDWAEVLERIMNRSGLFKSIGVSEKKQSHMPETGLLDSLRLHSIVSREKVDFATAQCSDFVLGGEINVEQFDKKKYTPYQYCYKSKRFFFVDTSLSSCKEPFFYQSQFKNAREVITIPFGAMNKVYGLPRPDLKPTLVLSIGRCGSTLFSKLMAEAGFFSFSEPDIFTGAVEQQKRPIVTDVFRYSVQALISFADIPDSEMAIKFRSYCNVIIKRIHNAFPNGRYVFIVRNIRDWSASFISKFNWSKEQLLYELLAGVKCLKYLKKKDIPYSIIWYEDFCSSPKKVFELISAGRVCYEDVEDRLVKVASIDSQLGSGIKVTQNADNISWRVNEFLKEWEKKRPIEDLEFLGIDL